jgi:hypothetical protein
MLFDLRARGRRRTIKVIYTLLAVLMGFGLIGFGIGGNVSGGGLIDGIFGDDANVSDADEALNKRIENAEKRLATNPQDAAALLLIARTRVQLAGTDFDDVNQRFTEDGLTQLRQASSAWERYLATDPKNPDPRTARLMVQAFGAGGLNQPAKAVTAQEIVVEDGEAAFGDYYQLAGLAYQAGQTRKGDLARDKALELAPKDQRSSIKAQLESLRSNAQNSPLGSQEAPQPSG